MGLYRNKGEERQEGYEREEDKEESGVFTVELTTTPLLHLLLLTSS